ESPVTLPPGRARLATKPEPTGSAAVAITIGMAVVAFFAADADGFPAVTIRSTFRRTRSAASSDSVSGFCSPNRYSMVIFFTSIHPSLLISCRNASTRIALPAAVLESRKPMRKILPVCCASTEPQTAKSMAPKLKARSCFFICVLSRLSNDFGRPRQYIRWSRHADLLRRFEINHQLELRRLLDRQIGRFGSLEDSVHVIRDAPISVRFVRPVGHEPTGIYKLSGAHR